MSLNLPLLVPDELEARYQRWVGNVAHNHPDLDIVVNKHVAWSLLKKPMSKSTVALLSTAGTRRADDAAFDTSAALGDYTFRRIPASASGTDLVVDDIHIDTSDASHDINCQFPIESLGELKRQGEIGRVASAHFSFLGFLMKPEQIFPTVDEIAKELQDNNVDVVIIDPG